MIAYLDTNVYIRAKYQFSTGKFQLLRSHIADGNVSVIYSTATRGEVEQHMQEYIKEGVTKFNRVIRKEMIPLMSVFGLSEIDEDTAVQEVMNSLSSFLSMDGVTQIDLNPMDVEQLMADYFNGTFPFEEKKPYEFKDAIMISAVKQYQERIQEQIVVVSADAGFQKAFQNDENFIVKKNLSDLLHLCQNEKVAISVQKAIDEGQFDELIQSHIESVGIYRDDYQEWECERFQIDKIQESLLDLKYIDGKYHVNLQLILYMDAIISHRDEDSSYYDKEERRYLREVFVTWNEKHRVETEMVISCNINKIQEMEYAIVDSSIIEDETFKILDLDDETMEFWDDIKKESREDAHLIYCSECGAAVGYYAEYSDYEDKPLCLDCMISNSRGEICPSCGKKYPTELMMGGFCSKCLSKED